MKGLGALNKAELIIDVADKAIPVVDKAIPVIDDISERIIRESINEGYVFNESFINQKIYKNYKKH